MRERMADRPVWGMGEQKRVSLSLMNWGKDGVFPAVQKMTNSLQDGVKIA
jgi:hypothetical protein